MEKQKYALVCGSSNNNVSGLYLSEAIKVGGVLSQNNYNLVYGACFEGSMGIMYETMKSNGSDVIGVAPTLYKDDFNSLDCDEEYCVDTTNQRIEFMIEKSDIVLFLAGGTGTFEELIVIVEKQRRKEINKPIIIYDEHEFYFPLMQQFALMEEYGMSNGATDLFGYVTSEKDLDLVLKDLHAKKIFR